MKLSLEGTGEANRIRRYEPGAVSVNDRTLTRTLLLTPWALDGDWGPDQWDGFEPAHMEELVSLEPEILLIGTGGTQRFPRRELMKRAIGAGIGVEVMTTEAACRTYNVLASEERRVVAVLFMIEPDSPGS